MEQNSESTDIGWIVSAIKETRLFWLEVYNANHIAGYIMLFAVFFLAGYALYVWGERGKQKSLDCRVVWKQRSRRHK